MLYASDTRSLHHPTVYETICKSLHFVCLFMEIIYKLMLSFFSLFPALLFPKWRHNNDILGTINMLSQRGKRNAFYFATLAILNVGTVLARTCLPDSFLPSPLRNRERRSLT